MNKFVYENYETFVLDAISHTDFQTYSEMLPSESAFLNGIIRKHKPLKILEIGVAAGASSVLILNAIKDLPGAHLHSIDLSTSYYKNALLKTGFLIKNSFPELMNKWTLHTGGIALEFLDSIGTEIDLCLLDAAHVNPGELLDFLMIYPYLKKNAIIVIHDLIYQHNIDCRLGFTCATLFSALKGEKFIPQTYTGNTIPNIGMVRLADLSDDDLLSIFWMLTLYWSYYPTEKQKLLLKSFLHQHYENRMSQIIDFMFDFRYKEFESTKFRQIVHILIPEHIRAFILRYLPFLKEKKQ